SLEIREDLKIQVRAPRWVAEREIAQFIDSRRGWIEKAQLEIKRRMAVLQGCGTDGLYWNGKIYPVIASDELRERFCFAADRFLIHPLWVNEAEKVAESWFRKQAAAILEQRLRVFSESSGLLFRHFRLGRARTRWGSCSHGGTITLHWRLLWVPDWVRDYVIFHELCHLRHFDHSRAFWQAVAGLFPEYRRACAWLKEHAGMLTLPFVCPIQSSEVLPCN
ncbi:MAG: M48 family metallopeptidase, partial [Candidatus Omnitrophica bacterium]|nr:M48 family metallopeptidase [Candidatus Omnitrophota bacterium]